jgi:uncharacterized FAD-dependent dehydrogenase
VTLSHGIPLKLREIKLDSFNSEDVIILGGGLAGLFAAIKLVQANKKVTLVDNSLPEAHGKLGGFAKFSGAKFSLPPAGMGLAALTGSSESLQKRIEEVIEILGIGGLDQQSSRDCRAAGTVQMGMQTELRSYSSIVLTPNQIDDLIARLTVMLEGRCQIIQGEAKQLTRIDDKWAVDVKQKGQNQCKQISASAVFYAAGRLASDILDKAGAAQYPGKGLDLGFRVEFLEHESLRSLRSLGPDAKIIRGTCRTFCLNSPGEIYYYKYGDVNIPGGIVADKTVSTANVGILARTENKENGIHRVIKNFGAVEAHLKNYELRTGVPQLTSDSSLIALFGEEIASQLQDFVSALGDLKLINWSRPYRLHMPLIDWYWNTYCATASHKTSLPLLYALGDSAGHARGLLQAALSGWIASEEYLHDITH